MPVSYLPTGHNNVSPYLIVPDAAKAIEFLQQVFTATVIEKLEMPGYGIMHAEVKIGDSVIMLGTSNEKWPPIPAKIHIYVPDADATYQKAIAAGATVVMEIADQFYGDRSGGVKDTQGNSWWIATHKEDVSHDELLRRSAAMGK